ncbi:MAG: peptide MFS transporter [Aridibacter famidurans]|nr:peptide MFS transporter [Aridibacter famidurans]
MSNNADPKKHPKGLYVLFATEMWERFSFYSMLALFTLYLQDPVEGFSWTPAQATSLYANYLMFVYASPLIGGFLADKVLGYRKAVMIGGFFFMAGHGLLSIPAMWAVYAALTCLVIGNGFFKPNVSTMVGNLYPEGSHLKDRAYNIFYMGINIGAFLAPVVMEVVKANFGFHPAFAVAAFGMVISVGILWWFKSEVERADELAQTRTKVEEPTIQDVDDDTVSDLPPANLDEQAASLMASVPNWKRVAALIVIFAIVIVFWMVFHQNGSTLTYWANDNTDWNVSGIISNAINPFWVVTLTFPLVWLWKYLDDRGKEPSTPAKMGFGMLLVACSFFFLSYAAFVGESQQVDSSLFGSGSFRVNERVISYLKDEGVPEDLLNKVAEAKNEEGKNLILEVKFEKDDKSSGADKLTEALGKVASAEQVTQFKDVFLEKSYQFLVSPWWLIIGYGIVTLGELMLSPMGLSLVSKVAPINIRGLMMGGWFVATAIGNKLTMIGIYWSIWKQSSFFLVLGLCAFAMAILLAILLKPLKKAMPGV